MRSPSMAGSGRAAATTSRGATRCPFTSMGAVESRPSLRRVRRTSMMNSSPRPYLNVTRRQSTQRGIRTTSSMLDVDALDFADGLGEDEALGLGERLRRVPAAIALPHQRRVQALLDGRPDRERRREGVALDDQVGAVAHADLVDLGEKTVGGVTREDVREARLDPDAHERQEPRLLPLGRGRELGVAELD